MIGITTGLISFAMEMCIIVLYYLHLYLTDLAYYWPLELLVWSAYLMVLFHIAYAIVKYISPNAIGSGLPEMKSVLNGVILEDYLSFKTLFTKVVGLVAVIGGGIVVGREGPFVHVASTVAHLSLSIPIYRYIKKSASLLLLVQTSAIAAGMASNFGAPIGGT